MSIWGRRPDTEEPEAFSFDAENEKRIPAIVAKYPVGRQASAVLPLLDLAMRQMGGWVPRAAILEIARRLNLAVIRVEEVASFYSMINLRPCGRYFVQICRTTPCWLRGSDEILDAVQRYLSVKVGETSADGKFSLVEVECLGACSNAPVVQINDDYYEDLTAQTIIAVLKKLRMGEAVAAGSQAGRRCAAPAGGATTLNAQDRSR